VRISRIEVSGSRGVDLILSRLGISVDAARGVETGVLGRRKVLGRWLYYDPDIDVDEAIDSVFAAVESQTRSWLFTPTTFLRHPVASSLEGRVTPDAVEVILPYLLQHRRLGSKGLLTNSYQPYVAVYSWEDAVEIDRQIDAMWSRLHTFGRVTAGDLPNPLVRRSAAGWTSSVLRHGEFLGWGCYRDAMLCGWG
jgi:hypothetical protein